LSVSAGTRKVARRSPRRLSTIAEFGRYAVEEELLEHSPDLADFFRSVLEDDSARGRYVIGNGVSSTVAELTEAAAVAAGAPGAVPGSDDEARARLGDYFAEVLLLDQDIDAAKARAELGWNPSHPSLLDEFRHGSYRQ
jgi:nucleoside-diphosphate-sugar epimerase